MVRLVAPEIPYHVTQRGNGGERVFFSAGDYAACHDLLADAVAQAEVSVWAW